MARIRHLAIRTDRQQELAAFYRTTFGMTELPGDESASGKSTISLSDGEINLAIIPSGGKPEGLAHLGFEVENIESAAGEAIGNGASQGAPAPPNGKGTEAWIADPIGQRVGLSSDGWNIGGGGNRRIQHVAIKTDYPDKLAAFYMETFGLHEILRRAKERGAVYISDGHVNLAILPNNNNGDDEVADRMGIDHFGFLTDNVDATLKTAYDLGATPRDRELPRDGRFAEVFMRDPIGQRVDLSQSGWKTQP